MVRIIEISDDKNKSLRLVRAPSSQSQSSARTGPSIQSVRTRLSVNPPSNASEVPPKVPTPPPASEQLPASIAPAASTQRTAAASAAPPIQPIDSSLAIPPEPPRTRRPPIVSGHTHVQRLSSGKMAFVRKRKDPVALKSIARAISAMSREDHERTIQIREKSPRRAWPGLFGRAETVVYYPDAYRGTTAAAPSASTPIDSAPATVPVDSTARVPVYPVPTWQTAPMGYDPYEPPEYLHWKAAPQGAIGQRHWPEGVWVPHDAEKDKPRCASCGKYRSESYLKRHPVAKGEKPPQNYCKRCAKYQTSSESEHRGRRRKRHPRRRRNPETTGSSSEYIQIDSRSPSRAAVISGRTRSSSTNHFVEPDASHPPRHPSVRTRRRRGHRKEVHEPRTQPETTVVVKEVPYTLLRHLSDPSFGEYADSRPFIRNYAPSSRRHGSPARYLYRSPSRLTQRWNHDSYYQEAARRQRILEDREIEMRSLDNEREPRRGRSPVHSRRRAHGSNSPLRNPFDDHFATDTEHTGEEETIYHPRHVHFRSSLDFLDNPRRSQSYRYIPRDDERHLHRLSSRGSLRRPSNVSRSRSHGNNRMKLILSSDRETGRPRSHSRNQSQALVRRVWTIADDYDEEHSDPWLSSDGSLSSRESPRGRRLLRSRDSVEALLPLPRRPSRRYSRSGSRRRGAGQHDNKSTRESHYGEIHAARSRDLSHHGEYSDRGTPPHMYDDTNEQRYHPSRQFRNESIYNSDSYGEGYRSRVARPESRRRNGSNGRVRGGWFTDPEGRRQWYRDI